MAWNETKTFHFNLAPTVSSIFEFFHAPSNVLHTLDVLTYVHQILQSDILVNAYRPAYRDEYIVKMSVLLSFMLFKVWLLIELNKLLPG